MYPYLSLVPMTLIAIGFVLRRQRRAHVPLMLVAILLDVGLIIKLETSRQVVDKAMHAVSPLLKFHIAVAVSTVLAYCVMLVTVSMLLWGARTRKPDKLLGLYVMVARLIVSVTAFFVVGPV